MKASPTIEPPLKPIIEPPNYIPPSLQGLERLAWLMDRAFKIPGTSIHVGLDSILGLFPVAGDFLTGLIQAGIVVVAMTRYHVPKPIAARMAANVLIDIVVGAIPFVGDAFDVYFKANTRNLSSPSPRPRRRRSHPPSPRLDRLVGLVPDRHRGGPFRNPRAGLDRVRDRDRLAGEPAGRLITIVS